MPEDERLIRLSRELFIAAFAPPGVTEIESWFRTRLMAAFEEFSVQAGDRLYSEGDPSDYVYFVRDGSFRLQRGGAGDLVFRGRWVLGSFDVLADRPRPRTAIAEKPAQLVRLRAEEWTDLLEDSFSLARNVVLNIALSVARLYERLAPGGGLPEPGPPLALELPEEPLNLIERSLVLMEVPLLRGAGVQALTDIAANASELALRPGQELSSRIQDGRPLFVVVRGVIEATLDSPKLLARFGPASLVFGAAAFAENFLGWSGRALTDVRILMFSLDDWLDQMEEHFDGVWTMLRLFAIERERLLDQIAQSEGELVLT